MLEEQSAASENKAALSCFPCGRRAAARGRGKKEKMEGKSQTQSNPPPFIYAVCFCPLECAGRRCCLDAACSPITARGARTRDAHNPTSPHPVSCTRTATRHISSCMSSYFCPTLFCVHARPRTSSFLAFSPQRDRHTHTQQVSYFRPRVAGGCSASCPKPHFLFILPFYCRHYVITGLVTL